MIYLLGPRRRATAAILCLTTTNIGTALALAAILATKPAVIERIPADLVRITDAVSEKQQAYAYAAGYVAGQNRTMLAIGHADLLTAAPLGAERYAEIAARHGFNRSGDAP